MEYNLEDRCIIFSKRVLCFCKDLEKERLLKPISTQLLRSATSIGANYCEANGAVSRKDFRNKIHICKKEAQETRYWLKIVDKQELEKERLFLIDETEQLVKIFGRIAEKSK